MGRAGLIVGAIAVACLALWPSAVAATEAPPVAPAPAPVAETTPTTDDPADVVTNGITEGLAPLLPWVIAIGAVVVAATLAKDLLTPSKSRRRRRSPGRSRRPTHRSTRSRRESSATETFEPAPAPPLVSDPPTARRSDDPAPEANPWGRPAGASAEAKIAALREEQERWEQGRQGEVAVAAALDALPEGEWWVFHDITIGARGANVDHLVIGVGGVFTVNTKNLTGNAWVAERAFLVNGRKTAYLPKAVEEGARVAERLGATLGRSVEVHPVLAVYGASLTIKAMPDDVTVLSAPRLAAWLESQPRRLTPHDAYAVVLAANDPATWRPPH